MSTLIALFLIFALFRIPMLAQDSTPIPAVEPQTAPFPAAYTLSGFDFERQGWNNCGPATLTNALTFFGYTDNQFRAAGWLKPNTEDKNVTLAQMVEFVSTQIPELPVNAVERAGGTLPLLKRMLANDFPVVIHIGFDPIDDASGWMGHYLLLSGYNDADGVFVTQDSYHGADISYEYAFVEELWQHFNYEYIVVYENERAPQLLDLLGDDADAALNAASALERAEADAAAEPANAFAWFNAGTNLVALGEMERAAAAFDEARRIGIPWRMLWYQFGPFEAYLAVGRYGDVIELARANLNDGGGHYVEETFYYAALAREALGETGRAIDNLREAVNLNPNFAPAREKLDALTQ